MSSTICDTGLSSNGRHVEIQEGRDRSDAQLRRRFKESFTLSLTFSKAEKQGIADGGDRKELGPVATLVMVQFSTNVNVESLVFLFLC